LFTASTLELEMVAFADELVDMRLDSAVGTSLGLASRSMV